MYPFVLYHGTDWAIWTLTQEKQAEIKNACMKIIEYIVPVIEEKQYELYNVWTKRNQEILGDDFVRIYDSFSSGKALIHGREMYQYNSFYVTNMLDRAKIYARKAVHFGEIGHHAYNMRYGAEKIGLELPPPSDEVKAAIDTTLWFESLKHEPMVLCLEGVEIGNLLMENGIPLLGTGIEKAEMGLSFRLNGFDTEKMKASIIWL